MITFLFLMLGILVGTIIGAAFASDTGAHRTGRIRTIGGDVMPRLDVAAKWRRATWALPGSRPSESTGQRRARAAQLLPTSAPGPQASTES